MTKRNLLVYTIIITLIGSMNPLLATSITQELNRARNTVNRFVSLDFSRVNAKQFKAKKNTALRAAAKLRPIERAKYIQAIELQEKRYAAHCSPSQENQENVKTPVDRERVPEKVEENKIEEPFTWNFDDAQEEPFYKKHASKIALASVGAAVLGAYEWFAQSHPGTVPSIKNMMSSLWSWFMKDKNKKDAATEKEDESSEEQEASEQEQEAVKDDVETKQQKQVVEEVKTTGQSEAAKIAEILSEVLSDNTQTNEPRNNPTADQPVLTADTTVPTKIDTAPTGDKPVKTPVKPVVVPVEVKDPKAEEVKSVGQALDALIARTKTTGQWFVDFFDKKKKVTYEKHVNDFDKAIAAMQKDMKGVAVGKNNSMLQATKDLATFMIGQLKATHKTFAGYIGWSSLYALGLGSALEQHMNDEVKSKRKAILQKLSKQVAGYPELVAKIKTLENTINGFGDKIEKDAGVLTIAHRMACE